MAFEDISKKNWYSILGAEPSDNLKELKRKYQRLILLYHPDKQSTDVPAGEAEARMQRFIEIDRAWKILGNEETKKEYDLQRREIEINSDLNFDQKISHCFTCGRGSHQSFSSANCQGHVKHRVQVGTFPRWDNTHAHHHSKYELEQGCPVDTQVSLEDMTWNHSDHCYSFMCRCGGKYIVSKNEVEDVSSVSCDTCSLVIEII